MKAETNQKYVGGCACGSVRYEVLGPHQIVAQCCCEKCQRFTGTGHSTGAMFSLQGFTITGKLTKYIYQSDNQTEVTKSFCPQCGSQLFGENSGASEYITISLGTMDNSSEFMPEVAIYAEHLNGWDNLQPGILTFDKLPLWKPDS